MQLPELCIRRPVMTTLMMCAILFFGVFGYSSLPISDLPNVEFPTISVSAALPGAAPETMASTVATPLEAQLSTIPGIATMNSTSTQGATSITIQFELSRSIDAAAQDVQTAIAAVQKKLPSEMTTPPTISKTNPADSPIIYLVLRSDTLHTKVVNEYASTVLAQRLSMVSGVAQASVLGAQKSAVRIQLNPDELASRNIGLDEVQAAVASANAMQPVGTLSGERQTLGLKANGQITNAAAFQSVVVAYRNGAPVKVGDLGLVVDSLEATKTAGWFGNKRAIVIAVQRQSGSNTVATVDAIRALMPSFLSQLPASVTMEVLYDRSDLIRESIKDVQYTLLLSAVLVVLVILVFLRNISATLIPALALPLSLVGTFAVMYPLGYSLDNLSLLALTLAVGYVVDDAIVMLENIVRHIEEGVPPFEAAIVGAREIGFTILSMTASLVAVFIPVMFMQGIVGRLLHEFAVVIVVAIVVSAFVSLTLTPMLCSRYLRSHSNEKHGKVYQLFERVFDTVQAGYKRTLAIAIRHQRWVLASFVATILATIGLFNLISKDFLPGGDVGQLRLVVEGPDDASFDYMVAHQMQLRDIVSKDPNVNGVFTVVSPGGNRNNYGIMVLELKPASQRKMTPNEIITKLRPQVSAVPGVRAVLLNPPAISIGGQSTASQFQYTLQSSDTQLLYQWSETMLSKLKDVSGLVDVNTTLKNKSPVVALDLDRERIAALGLSIAQVESALQTAYGSRQVSTIYGAVNQYQVILELDPSLQGSESTLSRLKVRSNTGALVPLDTVVTTARKTQVLSVDHLGQLPSVTLSFNLKEGVALGEAVQRVSALEKTLRMPATITASLQGTAQAFKDSQQGLGVLLLVAVVVVYLVLGVLYESFIHPLTILSGLPAAGLGALITLLLFKVDLSLYAFVGIIMLVGIVKKNAIMMIDFAVERERNHGATAEVAIVEACLIRFRPIMMTTLAALAGVLPIALGIGTGAETRQPLGLAVVGGLVISQFLTLYLTPVVYLFFDRISPSKSGTVA